MDNRSGSRALRSACLRVGAAHVEGMSVPIQLNIARPEHGQRIAEIAAESRGRKQVAKGEAQQIAASTAEPGHLWLIASAGQEIARSDGHRRTTRWRHGHCRRWR